MELLTIFVRTIIIFIIVLISLRLMGKREIGELSVFDVVVTLMIAELAALVIEDTKRSLWFGIIPIATLVSIQIFIAYVSLRSKKLRQLVDGTPMVLIENGKICDENMKKLRYNMDDLLSQLREKEIVNISDVEFAILETSGSLSIFPKKNQDPQYEMGREEKHEKRARSSEPPYSFFLPLPLIIDGKIQEDSLEKIQQTRFWLKNQIQAHGVQEFKDVMFATISREGVVYVDKKDRS